MTRSITYILFLMFISINSNAAIFEEGPACQSSKHLIGLTTEFDAGRTSEESQPIYNQLQNVDRNLRATTGDVAAIFQTILTLRYRRAFSEDQFVTDNPFLKAQFLAYRVMDMACEILTQGPITLAELRAETIKKAQEVKGFTDAHIAALIPDAAVTMVQYPEFTPEGNGQVGQEGVLLGHYDKEKTLEALQTEKDQGKAIYLVLGLGNRQPAPAGQRTPGGKDIVWVYLDRSANVHSTNRKEYFLWEDFNQRLGRIFPEGFFDAVIFDRAVVHQAGSNLETIIGITKVLKENGFCLFDTSRRGFPPFLCEGVDCEFKTTFFHNGKTKGWPAVHDSQRGIPVSEEALRKLEKSRDKCLEELFKDLFSQVTILYCEDTLNFKVRKESVNFGFNQTSPGFLLEGPRKGQIKSAPFYGWLYR